MAQKKEIMINNIRIAYIEHIQDPKSPVTLFLHGWASSKESFHLLFPHCINFIAFDFPGCGHSGNLDKEFRLDDYVSFLEAFFTKKLQNKKVHVVAHSFGGRVLLKWVSVKKMLSFESVTLTGVPLYRTLSSAQKLQNTAGTWFTSPLLSWAKPVVKKLYTITHPNTDYTALRENPILKKTFQNIVQEDISVYLPVLENQKTSLIWGEDDAAAPVENAEKACSLFPHFTFTRIPNAGHFPWSDNCPAFVSALPQNTSLS